MALNGISELATKELRQKAKLDLAATNRAAQGNSRATYDITQLPTQYDDNGIVDNDNTGGLVEGRPWIVTPSITTNNLIVNLDAGNTNSYPGTGATWTNLVDDTDYTISNGTFDSGNGGSIVFNGTSTFVDLGILFGPSVLTPSFTKEAWVNADIVTSGRNIISSESNVFWNNGSTLSGGVGDSYSLVTSSNFPVTTWRHVVLTFDDTLKEIPGNLGTMRLYINGVQVSENTSVAESYTIDQIERIGAHFFNGNPVSFWDGKIAEVRVYNTALTGANVLTNYNNTKTRYGL
jgi:hypothetical protein